MSTQMYVDKSTNQIISRSQALASFGGCKAKEVPLSAEDLVRANAALLLETSTGDIPTGKAVLVDGQYFREYRDFTPEENYQSAKKTRAQAVNALTVTTEAGNTFDGDEDSQNRMARAITLANAGETTPWKLADNSVILVTSEELKEALRLAGEAQTALWMI